MIQSPPSRAWSATAKIVVGLSLVAILFALIIRAQNLIGPLLLTLVVIYALRPVATLLVRLPWLGWRLAVSLIYLALLTLLGVGIARLGGMVVAQGLNIINTMQVFLSQLPALITELPLSRDELDTLISQVAGMMQPVLGQAGIILSAVVSTTASTIGWGLLMILISYFILLDLNPSAKKPLFAWAIPGYAEDSLRLRREFNRIWNVFLQSQGILFLLTVAVYSVLLSVLGVSNVLALALLAGLTRFVPYIGATITWVVTAVVTLLQAGNYLGLAPLPYTLVVLTIIIIFDQAVDYGIAPRLFGQALGLHPVAVLLSAFVGASLIGVVGVLLAAPLLATLLLIGRYVVSKLLDLEPWPVSAETLSVAQRPHVPDERQVRAT